MYASAHNPLHLTIGSLLGPYRVLAPLGAGGMGEVYRARDEKLNRDVALKVLSADLAASAEHLRRFQQEAHAASALNHPNIITIYDIGQFEGTAYIAMELVDGQDLRMMESGERLPLKNVLRISTKVADGLAAAHERGIVHRDLKPENVMVSRDGFVKILDFGLAKLVKPITENQSTLPHTTPGAVFGTVAYMSPEQAAGRALDFRSDQFALGVILYEMLSGHMPFHEPTAAETLAAIIRHPAPPITTANEAVPPELARVLDRCLAKDPAERYAATRDLARDLREIRDRISSPSEPRYRSDRRPPSPSRKRVAWIGATAAVAVITIATLVRFHEPAPPVVQRTMGAAELSSAADQKAYAEALGLLQVAKDEKSIDHAIAILEKLLQNARDYAPVNAQLARALLYKAQMSRRPGLIEQATIYAERAAEIDGSQPDTHVRLGQLRLAAGRYGDAESEFRRALAIRGDYVDAYVNLADTYGLMGHASAAEEMYKKALALRPNDANTYDAYAVFLFNIGRPREAAAKFRRATELLPTARGFNNLGGAYQALGNYEAARHAYEKSIAVAPDSYAYVNLGSLYFYDGKYAEAARAFKAAVKLARGSYQAWLALGDTFRSSGARERSIAPYEDAVKVAADAYAVNPGDAVAHATSANALAKLGRFGEANREITTALKLDPMNQTVRYHAAVVALLRGNSDTAIDWLQGAVSAGYPTTDLARDPEFRVLHTRPSFPTHVASRN